MAPETYVPTYLRPHRRRYTCAVCGRERTIEVRQIEKSVVVCVHPDTRGTFVPVIQKLEEGEVLE
jgi:hypothetical protein